jgi:predicted NUDIX family phosphoesterase
VCINGTVLEESVFAISTQKLWKLLPYKEQGLIKGNTGVLDRIVREGVFRKRSELEEDPSYKQIISYAIISNDDSLYLLRRISGQREKRLHNKLYLGLGGHMNPSGSGETGEEYLENELKREFFEEVNLSNGCIIEDIRFIGFINDDSIPVGRVHIGLLYQIRVSNQHVAINEKDKISANWVQKHDLFKYYEEMETWTRIAVDHYLKLKLSMDDGRWTISH